MTIDLSGVSVDINTIRPVAGYGRFPGNDRARLNRFSVAANHAVAVDRLIGARRTNADELHAQRISHSILFSQAQDVVAGILEVSHASQGYAPRLRGWDRQVEALGGLVVGNDFFGISIRLKRGVGKADQFCGLVSAVHCEGSAFSGEYTARITDGIGRKNQRGSTDKATSAGVLDDSSTGISARGDIGTSLHVGEGSGSRSIYNGICTIDASISSSSDYDSTACSKAMGRASRNSNNVTSTSHIGDILTQG